MGPKREVPGALPRRPGDHEQQPDLVATTRIRVRLAATGRVRRGTAPSPPRPSERQAAIDAGAGGEHPAGGGRAISRQQPAPDTAGGDRHPANTGEHRLRSKLQSDSGLRIGVAIPVISAVLRAPPPGYYFGTALATGLAFATGAAIAGGLWGWASPGWGGGNANVNVNRYNNINVNRSQIASSRWSAGAAEWEARQFRPCPGGPAGYPAVRKYPYPAMRSDRQPAPAAPAASGGPGGRVVAGGVAAGGPGGVGGLVGLGGAGRESGGVGGVGRPGGPGGVGGIGGPGRPGGGAGGVGGVGGAGRPGGPGGVGGVGGGQQADPAAGWRRPACDWRAAPRGAFGDISSGRQAGQFGQRGAQSRSVGQQRSAGGGARGGGASRGGGARGGGGGASRWWRRGGKA